MKPASILVADDESAIRLMLKTALESEGYVVEEAADGRQALESLQRKTPDLLVLDLNMPVIDGTAVLEQMKSLAGISRARVIVLTAYGSIPAAVKATRLGAAGFLEKPMTPRGLRSAVKEALSEPAPEMAAAQPRMMSNLERSLDKARKALRLADYGNAELLLAQVAQRNADYSAQYLNLSGVLNEARGKLRRARKSYGRALTANEMYEPARQNMRRLTALRVRGMATQATVLGDESTEVMYARLPESRG